MRCPYCSEEIEEEAVICGHCGAAVMEPERLRDADGAARYLERAFALEDGDEYKKALEECERAIRLDPTLADAHNLRGVILEELGFAWKARLAYREALRLDPGFGAARENLQAVEAELQAGEETTRWIEDHVLFEAEGGASLYTWQQGRVEMEPMSGQLTVYGYPDGSPTITVSGGEIDSCEIVERQDIRHHTRGWSDAARSDLGCLLLGGFIAGIEAVFAKGKRVPVFRIIQSAKDAPDPEWVLHLRSGRRGHRGKVATLETAHRIVDFLKHSGYQGAIPEELSVPVEDLEALAVEASIPREMEVMPPATNWRFWFDFVAASLLGGLTVGALGGFVAGSLPVPFLAGILGGVIGGGVAAGIHWLGLRRYTSLTRRWVLVCCVVGAATWVTARGWAVINLGSWDPVSFGRNRLGAFVAAGAAAGAVGGAVSGILQARMLGQQIPGVAHWWRLLNTVAWAAGGAVYLPTFYAWGISLIGGGNPGASAAADIRVNQAICQPVCVPLMVVVPIWAMIQIMRRR